MIGWVSRLGTGQTYTYRAVHQRFLRKWKVCKIFNFLPCVKQFCVWKFYKGGFAMLCRLPEHNGLGDGAESGGQPGGRQQQLRLPHAGPVRDRENNGAESEADDRRKPNVLQSSILFPLLSHSSCLCYFWMQEGRLSVGK